MLKKVLEEIKQKNEILNRELVIDQRTLSNQIGNKERAAEDLKSLMIDLRNVVQNNCVIILAHGKHAESFANIGAEAFGCFSFLAQVPFELISQSIHDTYIGQTNSPQILDLAMEKFVDIASELGILGYNYPQFQQADAVTLTDRGVLIECLTNIFNRDIGGEFVLFNAIHLATQEIARTNFEGSRVPIIIHTENKELAEVLTKDSEFVTPNAFNLEVNKKQTEESVEKQLLNIKNKVR
jgi:hypothetical protein